MMSSETAVTFTGGHFNQAVFAVIPYVLALTAKNHVASQSRMPKWFYLLMCMYQESQPDCLLFRCKCVNVRHRLNLYYVLNSIHTITHPRV